MEENMPEEDSADAVKDWARAHIGEIEDVSRGIIADAGAEYPVSAAVTISWFPDKSYGDVTFPAGNYEALRIEIGEESYHASSKFNNAPNVAIAINQLAGANALDAMAAVKTEIERLSKSFPEDMEYIVGYDSTDYIRASI